MGFFKRYPIFCVVLVLLLAALGAGVYLAINETTKVKEAKKSYESKIGTLKDISRGVLYDPETGERVAPTAVNREVLEVRLGQVNGDLERIRQGLVRRTDEILSDSADEFTFLPKLQSFIASLKASAARNGVILESDEAFGFAKYAIQAAQPQKDMIPLLNRQRQVLEYILKQLINSQPTAIIAVERELIEVEITDEDRSRNRRRDNQSEDVFTIEDLVTARYNEFIDTSAFRLVFTGRTDVLRNFLNKMGKFELPLIVRSVEVEPATESDVPKAEEKPKESNSQDALFALFGGAEDSEPEEEAGPEQLPGHEPVITENQSKFTVVIEYVEVKIEAGDENEEAGS
ncbi:MAG: hypothetical protein ACQKBT_11115 [Puniceicoccales bacterium]